MVEANFAEGGGLLDDMSLRKEARRWVWSLTNDFCEQRVISKGVELINQRISNWTLSTLGPTLQL